VFLNILNVYGERKVGATRAESFEAALSDTMSQIELAICAPLIAADSQGTSLKVKGGD
jgi:hypothetical protein